MLKAKSNCIKDVSPIEAIVSDELWQQVRDKREACSANNNKVDEPERVSLLSGLIKCPACGNGLIASKNKHVNKNRGGHYKTIHYYSCRYYRKLSGRACGFKHTYNQVKIDSAVYEIVSNLGNHPAFEDAMAKVYGGDESVEAYEKRMKDIRKDLYHQGHEKNRLGEEQRELYRHFIERIEVYPEEQKDGRVLKSIYFRFPVRYGENDTVETWINDKGKPDEEIAFVLDCSEVRVTVAEAKATYSEIWAYVLEHTGMKVSSLYIAQVKRKYGIDIGKAYNKPEKNKNRVPVCPKDKELAIMDALKAFRMLTEDTEYMEAAL